MQLNNDLISNDALTNKAFSIDSILNLARSSAGHGVSKELKSAIALLARAPQLLVGTDYDGTIAPLTHSPAFAVPSHDSLAALRALASLPQTNVVVISGRSLRDLAAVSRLPSEVHLVGSHGSEFDIGFVEKLSPKKQRKLKQIKLLTRELVEEYEGASVEVKPAGVAVHYSNLKPKHAKKIVKETKKFAKQLGVQFTNSKNVVDLSVVKTSKGQALNMVRENTGTSAVLYMGDDVADEEAFETLRGPDLGIKVGTGETIAQYRVIDSEDVSYLLALLFEARRAWLFGETADPIEKHTLIGNGVSTAMLTPDAKICWLTHPLPNSAALFAYLLGGEPAGYFGVEPLSGADVLGQRYVNYSMVTETRWAEFKVTDYLEKVEHGKTSLVRVLEGSTKVRVTYAPRPDYSAAPFNLVAEGSAVYLNGVGEKIDLFASRGEFQILEHGLQANAILEVDLSEGPVVLNLRMGQFEDDPKFENEPKARKAIMEDGINWSNSLHIPNHKPQLVKRSALTLRSLCHEPTGGILAAATTSLPEGIGGTRNWDYRYCWLRDGSMTVSTLVTLGSYNEAENFLNWLDEILKESNGAQWLHPLYPVDGHTQSPEAILDHLPGYAGSRPVRIGNAADHQVQLDVFGPMAELIDNLAEKTNELSDFHWNLLEQMVEAVTARWMEPDHGIWEARIMPRHNIYTKVMCWSTIDHAVKAAKRHKRDYPKAWEETAKTIRDEVLEKGWSEKSQSYTVAYDSDEADSAVLHIGLSGMIGTDDERFQKTVAFIEKELRVGPTVFRYRYDDGLPGLEGGFHICTTWLIEAFVEVGRIDDALELFQQLVNLVGPTGLYAEEYDANTNTHLGNHPQAYSHIGFVRCARLLEQYAH
ncbi:MAG: trehalose-phosphatase [Micrococcaceae bacterium]